MKIGEFQSEKDVKENAISRDIVKEILQFGVNDRMILMIIHQLAMNLESIENMKEITTCVRELNTNTFLVDRADEDTQSEENKLII
jgi:hypothetical protein